MYNQLRLVHTPYTSFKQSRSGQLTKSLLNLFVHNSKWVSTLKLQSYRYKDTPTTQLVQCVHRLFNSGIRQPYALLSAVKLRLKREAFPRLFLFCVPDVVTAVLLPRLNDRNETLYALNGPKNTFNPYRSQFVTIPWLIVTTITTLNDSPKMFTYGAVHGPKYGVAMTRERGQLCEEGYSTQQLPEMRKSLPDEGACSELKNLLTMSPPCVCWVKGEKPVGKALFKRGKGVSPTTTALRRLYPFGGHWLWKSTISSRPQKVDMDLQMHLEGHGRRSETAKVRNRPPRAGLKMVEETRRLSLMLSAEKDSLVHIHYLKIKEKVGFRHVLRISQVSRVNQYERAFSNSDSFAQARSLLACCAYQLEQVEHIPEGSRFLSLLNFLEPPGFPIRTDSLFHITYNDSSDYIVLSTNEYVLGLPEILERRSRSSWLCRSTSGASPILQSNGQYLPVRARWLEREFTNRNVRGSNPTSASRLPLSRLGQPGSIPVLVLPSSGMAATHRKGVTAERFIYILCSGPAGMFLRDLSSATVRSDIQCLSEHGGAVPQAKFPTICKEAAISSQYEFASDGGTFGRDSRRRFCRQKHPLLALTLCDLEICCVLQSAGIPPPGANQMRTQLDHTAAGAFSKTALLIVDLDETNLGSTFSYRPITDQLVQTDSREPHGRYGFRDDAAVVGARRSSAFTKIGMTVQLNGCLAVAAPSCERYSGIAAEFRLTHMSPFVGLVEPAEREPGSCVLWRSSPSAGPIQSTSILSFATVLIVGRLEGMRWTPQSLAQSSFRYPISEQTEDAFASKACLYVPHYRFPVIETVAAGTNVPMAHAASVKSISTDTKLQQTRIPRILKSLIAKKLIKELPMSTGQKQKVYLLIDLQPSEKLAANTLFAGESGVDGEFVAILRTACLKYLQDKTNIAANIADPLERRNASYVSVEEIHRFISNARICNKQPNGDVEYNMSLVLMFELALNASVCRRVTDITINSYFMLFRTAVTLKVTMTLQDVQCVLDALKYGGELESRITSEIDRNISASSGSPSPMRTMYRLAPQTASTAGLAHLPCTVCMCRKDCRPGGSISPENCKLFNAFLDF
ncbi:DNA-directed RNA polymerase III subunit RPC6 [Clonorchis sinensis]|uniref:DNA-directed RNA polymerase III subunit RPC6 n=1 Tax=Clonorchis sinensis TaxID=79923 RepID=G7YD31_CLOSI|nr:DNA-directed RNA polymerase III subunit RPC6 [Clonorchis sinensis]